ncbi:MAG: hypothetical protein QOF24_2194, partial [Verrucomicrobiota bacterium]
MWEEPRRPDVAQSLAIPPDLLFLLSCFLDSLLIFRRCRAHH